MNPPLVKRENLLPSAGLRRGRRCGAGPAGHGQGKEVERREELPSITSFSSSPLTVPSPVPHFVSLPSCPHKEPCGIHCEWRKGPTGCTSSFPYKDERCVYHQSEFSGLKLKRGKIKNIISLLPRPISLLYSNISNSPEENLICRGNFWAWLMLFVSSAGQSGAVWQQVSEHNPSGEAERAVNKLWKFNDIQISEWLLKWYSG